MARYQISVTVEAIRIPEPEPEEPSEIVPGANPEVAQEKMMRLATRLMSGGSPLQLNPIVRPMGMNSSRVVQVRAESFGALAELLGQFDALAEKIECNNPVAP